MSQINYVKDDLNGEQNKYAIEGLVFLPDGEH